MFPNSLFLGDLKWGSDFGPNKTTTPDKSTTDFKNMKPEEKARKWKNAAIVALLAASILAVFGAVAIGMGLKIMASVTFSAPAGITQLALGLLMLCYGAPQMFANYMTCRSNQFHYAPPKPQQIPEKPKKP